MVTSAVNHYARIYFTPYWFFSENVFECTSLLTRLINMEVFDEVEEKYWIIYLLSHFFLYVST